MPLISDEAANRISGLLFNVAGGIVVGAAVFVLGLLILLLVDEAWARIGEGKRR